MPRDGTVSGEANELHDAGMKRVARDLDGTATYCVFDGGKSVRVEQSEAGSHGSYVREDRSIYSPPTAGVACVALAPKLCCAAASGQWLGVTTTVRAMASFCWALTIMRRPTMESDGDTEHGRCRMEALQWRETWRGPLVWGGALFAGSAAVGIPCWLWIRLLGPGSVVSRLDGLVAWFLIVFGVTVAAFLWFGVGALCRDRALQAGGLVLGLLAAASGVALLRGEHFVHGAALLCLPPGSALLALRASHRTRTGDPPAAH